VTADGGTGWSITHNTLVNDFAQTAVVWVGDPRYGPSSGELIGNMLVGGGYTIYGGPGGGAGIRVEDNAFSARVWRNGGYWGPVTGWIPEGNVWTGNVWADGPHEGEPVQP